MAINGTSEAIIARMLGHSSQSVTGIYARLNTEAARDAMESAQDAMFSGHFRSLLAQFGLTPKSKRGLAAGEALDAL